MRIVLALLLLIYGLIGPTLAQERIGAFVVTNDVPEAILLDGEIGINAPLEFRRALQANPAARVVVLSSDGGLVASALIIADDIHLRGLSTVVPEGARCFSACSFIFFAGAERLVEGELGVHQMWSEQPDLSGVQSTVSDILEVLNRFDTPTEVFTRMFRTPSEEMYVFTTAEVNALNLSRVGKTLGGKISLDRLAALIGPEIAPPATESTDPQEGSGSGLRLALYAGLDFYGQDISQDRVEDVVTCASTCMSSQQCTAFTFNANSSLTRGPNCFLKSGTDRLEGYRDALSGLFLPPNMSSAPTFRIGTIDPTEDVEQGRDYPGNDLADVPEPGITSPGQCRMACVDSDTCAAYSFATNVNQCWLKSEVGSPRAASDVISGTKRWQTFAPIEVLDIDE